jgi:hypothetical protein
VILLLLMGIRAITPLDPHAMYTGNIDYCQLVAIHRHWESCGTKVINAGKLLHLLDNVVGSITLCSIIEIILIVVGVLSHYMWR